MNAFDTEYWEARFAAAREELAIAEFELQLLEPDADRSALELKRRRLAWRAFGISHRVAEARRR